MIAPHAADIPSPVRGLVIRHAFVWSHEKAAGRDEGRKDRPAVIVMIAKSEAARGLRVVVVPVSHTQPTDPDGGLEIPDEVKEQLGFDMDPQWIVFDEINRFVWPGYDLRKVPRTGADGYGMLPGALFEKVLQGVLGRHQAFKSRVMDRD